MFSPIYFEIRVSVYNFEHKYADISLVPAMAVFRDIISDSNFETMNEYRRNPTDENLVLAYKCLYCDMPVTEANHWQRVSEVR
jgi:hypothetical protein